MAIFLSGKNVRHPAAVWQAGQSGGWRYALTDRTDGNVSFKYGSRPDVARTRAAIFSRLGIDPDLVLPLQLDVAFGVHWLDERPDVQGLSTSGFPSEGVWLDDGKTVPMLFVADCFPVGLYDPGSRAIGIFHAGRAALAAGLLGRMLAVGQERGINMKRLLAFVGPGICQAHYVFDRLPVGHAGAATQDAEGKWHLDLLDDIRMAFQEFGVSPDRVTIDGRCTREAPELFSHRREAGVNEGRFALLVQRYD